MKPIQVHDATTGQGAKVRISLDADRSDNPMQTLGAEGVIPSRQIESFLRDFKQFTHNIPSGKIVGFLEICPSI